MSEQPLMKDGLNPAAIKRIANSLAQIIPQFNARAFQKDAVNGIDALELKARVNHLINVLHKHYDTPFKKLSKQLMLLPDVWDFGHEDDSKAAFAAWPIIDYVAVHGLQHPQESLKVLENLTHLFTAEFAVRPFIQQHTEVTYAQLLKWCEHKSEHVRRLASEGSRPRLPWGMRLPQYIQNPLPLEAILNRLKADESLYVRRSVANNLNDISKDNSEFMLRLCTQWREDGNEKTDWVINHAMRSLIKAGDARVFSLLGFSDKPKVKVNNFLLDKSLVKLGGDLNFSFDLQAGNTSQQLIVDYVVYFMKANGNLAPKVFKLKKLNLVANASISIKKKQSFKPISTRTFYAGTHQLAIQINGKEVARQDFEVLS